jgi:F0F1-type ATP synthase delta subunit
MNANKGSVEAVVTVAEPLADKALEQVKKAIQGIAGKGKQVELKVEVDPKIMGGLKVVVGDRSIDLSVAARVQELSTALESQ